MGEFMLQEMRLSHLTHCSITDSGIPRHPRFLLGMQCGAHTLHLRGCCRNTLSLSLIWPQGLNSTFRNVGKSEITLQGSNEANPGECKTLSKPAHSITELVSGWQYRVWAAGKGWALLLVKRGSRNLTSNMVCGSSLSPDSRKLTVW